MESVFRGDAGAIGLIGYSFGGGVIANVSALLWNNPQFLDGETWVVYAGTMDAISTSLGGYAPFAMRASPALQWESDSLGLSLSQGYNFWEPNGDVRWSPLGGLPLIGAINQEIPLDNHGSIQFDPGVLFDIEQDAIQTFQNLGYGG